MDKEANTLNSLESINIEEEDTKLEYNTVGDKATTEKIRNIMTRFISNGLCDLVPCKLRINIVAARHDFKLKDTELGNRKFVYSLKKLSTDERYNATLAVNSEYYLFTNKLDLNTMLVIILGEALGDMLKLIYMREVPIETDLNTRVGFAKFLTTKLYIMYDRKFAENMAYLQSINDLISSIETDNWQLSAVSLLSCKVAIKTKSYIPKGLEMTLMMKVSFDVEDDLRELYNLILRDKKVDKKIYNSYLMHMAVLGNCRQEGEKQ